MISCGNEISTLTKHLMGYTTPVTECTYFVPLLSYDQIYERVQFVPTCPVFAGLVTYYLTQW